MMQEIIEAITFHSNHQKESILRFKTTDNCPVQYPILYQTPSNTTLYRTFPQNTRNFSHYKAPSSKPVLLLFPTPFIPALHCVFHVVSDLVSLVVRMLTCTDQRESDEDETPLGSQMSREEFQLLAHEVVESALVMDGVGRRIRGGLVVLERRT